MRLLSSVGPDMDRKGTSLDEAFHATGCHARIRSLVGVDPIMSLEI